MKEHIITNSDGGMKSSNDGKWDPKHLTAYDIYRMFYGDRIYKREEYKNNGYYVIQDNMRIASMIDRLYIQGSLDQNDISEIIGMNIINLLKFYKHLQQPILDGKYPAYNFCKMKSQESLDQIYESARRHFKQYLDGDTTEDHYSAVLANMCFMHIIHSNIKNNTDFYEI